MDRLNAKLLWILEISTLGYLKGIRDKYEILMDRWEDT